MSHFGSEQSTKEHSFPLVDSQAKIKQSWVFPHVEIYNASVLSQLAERANYLYTFIKRELFIWVSCTVLHFYSMPLWKCPSKHKIMSGKMISSFRYPLK